MSGQNCAHSEAAIVCKPRASLDDLNVDTNNFLADKARVYPGTGELMVDSKLWRSLDRLTRRAILLHELAHEEDPTGCEDCADARAGALMRLEGVSARAARDTLASVVTVRDAGTNVLRGWRAMDASLRRQAQSLDDGGQSLGDTLDPNGQSIDPTAGLDPNGQSLGTPSGGRAATPPIAPARTSAPPPPSAAPSTSHTAAFALVGIAVVLVILALGSKR